VFVGKACGMDKPTVVMFALGIVSSPELFLIRHPVSIGPQPRYFGPRLPKDERVSDERAEKVDGVYRGEGRGRQHSAVIGGVQADEYLRWGGEGGGGEMTGKEGGVGERHERWLCKFGKERGRLGWDTET
jgi:hypothetical protein